jgi:hypothetical protein
MFSKEIKRWFRAFEIAKILFEGEGYHTAYLKQAEAFIRRHTMYSPKISEELVPVLFRLATAKKMPMRKLVNRILKDYLIKTGKMEGGTESNEQKRQLGGLQGAEAESQSQGDPGPLRPAGRHAPKEG